jgi:hypothetical protein
VFRVPELNRWHLIVSGAQLVDELRKAPDDVLSFDAAVQDVRFYISIVLLNSHSLALKSLAIDWTLGPSIAIDPYHIPIVRNQLTRNLGNLFSGLRQEIVLAFDETIPPTEGTLEFLSVVMLNPCQVDIDDLCQNGPRLAHTTP